jgi:hypothetical protein
LVGLAGLFATVVAFAGFTAAGFTAASDAVVVRVTASRGDVPRFDDRTGAVLPFDPLPNDARTVIPTEPFFVFRRASPPGACVWRRRPQAASGRRLRPAGPRRDRALPRPVDVPVGPRRSRTPLVRCSTSVDVPNDSSRDAPFGSPAPRHDALTSRRCALRARRGAHYSPCARQSSHSGRNCVEFEALASRFGTRLLGETPTDPAVAHRDRLRPEPIEDREAEPGPRDDHVGAFRGQAGHRASLLERA